MRKPSPAIRADTTPAGSGSGACSPHPTSTSSSSNAFACSRTTPPRRACPVFSGHNCTSSKESIAFYYIGGSPQVPVLQVGQLISEKSVVLESGLKNVERSLLGFGAPHLEQFNLEPSLPMA